MNLCKKIHRGPVFQTPNVCAGSRPRGLLPFDGHISCRPDRRTVSLTWYVSCQNVRDARDECLPYIENDSLNLYV